MLTINNLDKIVGKSIHTKWIPETEGWVVKRMEEEGEYYQILIQKTDNSTTGNVHILLERTKVYDPDNNEFGYKLKGINRVNECVSNMITTETIKRIEDIQFQISTLFAKMIRRSN